jgi:hypothetical protein
VSSTSEIIPLQWVFDYKVDSDSNVTGFKARLVARGDKQNYLVNFDQTSSPVMRSTSKNILLALAAKQKWHVHQGDFTSAFLNGILRPREGETASPEQARMPPIFTSQPPGYEEDGKEGWVWLLYKALYGLRQSGRVWYQTVYGFLMGLGFKVSKADPAIFYRHSENNYLFLGIHVDDPLIIGSNLDEILQLEHTINASYSYRVQGELHHFLGCTYERDWEKGIISAHQGSYIDAAISSFNLEDASPAPSPLVPNQKIGREFCPTKSDEIAHMQQVPYRELVGLLMYIANGTRPDICYAVNMLAQVASNPGRVHWEAAKRIVRYLKGTRDLKLTWGSSSSGLLGYTDASHGSEDLGWKSMSGYVFLLAGGAISWSAKKQSLIALSTAESEYIAMTHAAKELVWIHSFISEILRPLSIPFPLLADNQSAIALAKNGFFSPRTKHIALRYHYIREALANSILSIDWVDTHSNLADIFTKALDYHKSSHLRSGMGLLHA